MSMAAGRVEYSDGDTPMALSLALHRVINGLVESVFALPDFDRCLLVIAAPGFEVHPSHQVALWAAEEGLVVPVQAPSWLDYEAVVQARDPEDRWDHVTLIVQSDPTASTTPGARRLRTVVTASQAGENLLGLLFDPVVARSALYQRA